MFLLIDHEGFRYWHVSKHGKDELLRHMNESQKTACRLLESWGYTLIQVYDDRRREAVFYKEGEYPNTVVYRK